MIISDLTNELIIHIQHYGNNLPILIASTTKNELLTKNASIPITENDNFTLGGFRYIDDKNVIGIGIFQKK